MIIDYGGNLPVKKRKVIVPRYKDQNIEINNLNLLRRDSKVDKNLSKHIWCTKI